MVYVHKLMWYLAGPPCMSLLFTPALCQEGSTVPESWCYFICLAQRFCLITYIYVCMYASPKY